MDHGNPNKTMKQYLDGEGKWAGTSPCICDACRARRAEEELKELKDS